MNLSPAAVIRRERPAEHPCRLLISRKDQVLASRIRRTRPVGKCKREKRDSAGSGIPWRLHRGAILAHFRVGASVETSLSVIWPLFRFRFIASGPLFLCDCFKSIATYSLSTNHHHPASISVMEKDSLTNLQAFGLALRIYRQRAGISQETLANLSGLHRTYVGSVERGERNVSLRNILALANALLIPASDLLATAENLLQEKTPNR